MLIQKSYWKKDNVDQAFILWMLKDPWYCHDPEGGKENQEQVRREYEEYREKGVLKENTYLFMILERIVDDRKFSYNCADCGFPKFIEKEKREFGALENGEFVNKIDYCTEACPLCGD